MVRAERRRAQRERAQSQTGVNTEARHGDSSWGNSSENFRKYQSQDDGFFKRQNSRDDQFLKRHNSREGRGRRDRTRGSARDNQQRTYILDRDVINYYQRIELMIDKNNFVSEDEMFSFLEGVYAEMEGMEVKVSQHVYGSKVLEKVINLSTPDQLRHLVSVFADFKSPADVFVDRYASHVLETLFRRVPDVVSLEYGVDDGPENQEDTEGYRPAKRSFMKIAAVVEENVSDWMYHPQGSHVVRSVIRLLGGQREAEGSGKRSARKGEQAVMTPWDAPVEFSTALVKIGKRVLENAVQNFDAACCQTAPAAVITALLESLASIDTTGERVGVLVRELVDLPDGCDPQQHTNRLTSAVLTHNVAAHVVEACIKVAPAAVRRDVYLCALRHKLEELALHAVGNFTVQRVFEHASEAALLNMMVDELLPVFPKLFYEGKVGVVVKVVDACARLNTSQRTVSRAVSSAMNALQQPAASNLVKLLLLHKPYSDTPPQLGEESLHQVSLLGSLLVQHLLRFAHQNNRPVVVSMLALEEAWVMMLARHACGSHVVQALFDSMTVAPAEKFKFMGKYKGKFVDLAMDKYGSRFLEAVYSVVDRAHKQSIASELADGEELLANNPYGRLLLKSCRIDQFKRRNDRWVADMAGNDDKRRLFADILDDQPAGTSASVGAAETRRGDKAASKRDASAIAARVATEEGVSELVAASELQPYLAALGFSRGVASNKRQRRKLKRGPRDERELEDERAAALHDTDEVTGAAVGEDAPTPAPAFSTSTSRDVDDIFRSSRPSKHSKGNGSKRAAAVDGLDGQHQQRPQTQTGEAVEEVADGKEEEEVKLIVEAIEGTKRRTKKRRSKSHGEDEAAQRAEVGGQAAAGEGKEADGRKKGGAAAEAAGKGKAKRRKFMMM